MAAHHPTTLEKPKTDADRLRDQAKAWRTKADWHTEQRRECMEEAWALEQDAAQLERETPALAQVSPARTREEHDAEFLRRLAEFLEDAGDVTSSDVAQALDVPVTRARTGLSRLEAIGLVIRTGLKRGTRYRLAPEDEAPAEPSIGGDNVRQFGNYATVVRDTIITLGTFEFTGLQRELPDLSEGTLRRWLRKYEDDGIVESVRMDGHKVYAYTKPETGHAPARRKEATPEMLATLNAPTTARGHVVAGAGRAVRVGTPIVDALIREASGYGVTITTSKHRVEYRLDGKIVATSSKTPGASSLKATRGQLRKAGVPV